MLQLQICKSEADLQRSVLTPSKKVKFFRLKEHHHNTTEAIVLRRRYAQI